MLILIEDTERGLDVARGLWGAFSSCLYIEDDAMEACSIDYTIDQCAKSGVTLIIVTNDMDEFKDDNPHAFCIECDGTGFGTSMNFLRFKKDYPRDRVVETIITSFKRNKLL